MKFVRWHCGCVAIEDSDGDAIVIEGHEEHKGTMFYFKYGGASTEEKTELGPDEASGYVYRVVSLLQDGQKIKHMRYILTH